MLTNISKKIFITGTDTEVGKTYVSTKLLEYLNSQGLNTLGIKPVASGAMSVNNKIINEDALSLIESSSVKLNYDHINPFVFREPIAPHIAAQDIGVDLSVENIINELATALNKDGVDYWVIEGAGGFLVPLNSNETMADLVKALNFEVILVVGIKLGCINHALLTYNAISQSGLKCCGWIANIIDQNSLYIDENIATIRDFIDTPLIGIVEHKGELIIK